MPENQRLLFAIEVDRILGERRLSWRKLAELTGYHPSWLSKIKNGAEPSDEVVRRCDQALGANGALIALAGAQPSPRPAQLPLASPLFVGREHELSEALNALAKPVANGAPMIVAIDGPAGVGKTALAVRASHIAGIDHFRGGNLFANLRGSQRPVGPNAVLEDFLGSLGVRAAELPNRLEARAKLLRSLLADRHMLIVLDDAASMEQLEPLLPSSAACGVIVTSRSRIVSLTVRTGARRIGLAPLGEEESIALLRQVTGSRATEDLAALARRCGHLPEKLHAAAEKLLLRCPFTGKPLHSQLRSGRPS